MNIKELVQLNTSVRNETATIVMLEFDSYL